MQIYIDTANLDEIRQAHDLGVLDGVTTNPSLVAKEGADFHSRLKDICRIVKGPVSAEVVSVMHDDMIAEAEPLTQIAPNIVIKLPCIVEGLKACKTLSDRGVKTNMTLCFQPLQAMLVAKAGAFLVSPFIGRVDDIAGDGMELIKQIRTVYDNYGFKTKILAASDSPSAASGAGRDDRRRCLDRALQRHQADDEPSADRTGPREVHRRLGEGQGRRHGHPNR